MRYMEWNSWSFLQESTLNRCGNKVVDEGEDCDCGSIGECEKIDPCCDPVTCKLKAEAQCAAGTCCDGCKVGKDNLHFCTWIWMVIWLFFSWSRWVMSAESPGTNVMCLKAVMGKADSVPAIPENSTELPVTTGRECVTWGSALLEGNSALNSGEMVNQFFLRFIYRYWNLFQNDWYWGFFKDNFWNTHRIPTRFVPFDSMAHVEHYDTYLSPLRFDAQVWGPTTKIRHFTVTQNQKFVRRVPKSPWFQIYMHVRA